MLKKIPYFCRMMSVVFQKNFRLILLIFIFKGMAVVAIKAAENNIEHLPAEKINLALRHTADALLRAAGDSTSRIPAIVQISDREWQVRLQQPFSYDQLPALLQASLADHGILQPYNVTVKRCDDGTIDLGYNYLDFVANKGVACKGRSMPEGCHYIEISFLSDDVTNKLRLKTGAGILLIFGSIAGFWFFQRQRPEEPDPNPAENKWVEFGNSRLNVSNQVLICSGISHTLTYRETKLLMLFVTHSGQLLERDYIIQQVWADEGVLVGRSVDVFVSRLRKKLVDDPSVGLAVVHGVGYRLESLKLV